MAAITSTRNAAVTAARALARPGARRRGDAFCVEGPQAVREATAHLSRLFATAHALARHGEIVEAARAGGVEVLEVSDEVLDALADARSPQGLVGVAQLPDADLEEALDGARLVVIAAGVADPGNVGTIIRSADAAGADAVVLADASCDAANPKAVRASVGSVFHLPVVQGVDSAAAVAAAQRAGLATWAADAAAPVTHTDADLSGAVALVVGSEAHGLAPALIDACAGAVAVPILGRAESLNVAATVAVLCYEAVRQNLGAPPAPGVHTAAGAA